MKKSLILVSTIVVLAILVGCNADQISGFGKGLEKVGDLGLGQRRTEPMKAAVENVKTFIADTEKNFVLNPKEEATPPKEGYPDYYDAALVFKGDSDAEKKENIKNYRNAINQVVKTLLAAKDSSARSKALKDALNARYEGLTSEVTAYKNLHAGLAAEKILGYILRHIDLSISDNRENVVMLLHFAMGIDVKNDDLAAIEKGVNTLKTTELPFPVQSSDYSLMVGKLFEQIKTIVTVVRESSAGGSESGGSKIDKTALINFQKDIATSVGSRDYQTVGDKISVGIVYEMMSTIIDIDNEYQLSPEYTQAEVGHKYDKFFEFVFENNKGLDYVDKMLNCLDAISYIYDVKLDMTGLVKGMI